MVKINQLRGKYHHVSKYTQFDIAYAELWFNFHLYDVVISFTVVVGHAVLCVLVLSGRFYFHCIKQYLYVGNNDHWAMLIRPKRQET